VKGARLDLIDRVVMMGGGIGCGNISAVGSHVPDQAQYAEFNIYYDPEAASIVFEAFSGRVTLLPLGVCETVCLTQLDIKKLTASKRSHRLMRRWLAFRKRQMKTGPKLDFPLYDPVAVAVAINEKLVCKYEDQEVVVDTTDEVRRGETRIQPRGSKVRVVSELDVRTARAMIMEMCFEASS
jgi:inosine-uridine nucleoside N-ribohydrolase